MGEVSKHLMASGARFCQSAMAAYDKDEWNVFTLHAGTALEHIIKARLAALNPALIAKRDHPTSLLWFADNEKHNEPMHAELRTIGLDECINLAVLLNRELAKHKERLAELQRARNSVAHLGAVTTEAAGQMLSTFLRTVILLVNDAGADVDDVFGDYFGFVVSQIKKSDNEQARVYGGRVAQARMRYEALSSNMTAEEAEHRRQLVEIQWHRRSIEEQLVNCPVCGFPAYVEGEVWLDYWEPEVDEDGQVSHYPVVVYEAADLRCPTCDLHLDSPDLVSLAGAMNSWELSDSDHSAFMSGYYDDQLADIYEDADR